MNDAPTPPTTTNSNRPTREQLREAHRLAKARSRKAHVVPASLKAGEKVRMPSGTVYEKLANGSLRRVEQSPVG